MLETISPNAPVSLKEESKQSWLLRAAGPLVADVLFEKTAVL
jgi:hypothetical protein